MTPREDEAVSLPAAIRRAREARGWSQVRLAKEVQTSERTVKRWEQGAQVPQPPFRDRLTGLGVPAALFVGAETREEIERRLRLVEGEIARIRGLLGNS